MAGVKLANIVESTTVELCDIPSQQCGNMCDQHDHAKICILVSVKHFNQTSLLVMTFTEIDQSQAT